MKNVTVPCQRPPAPRFMSVAEFASRLDRGIPLEDLEYFRRTRVAGEDIPDYLNWIRSAIGSVMVSQSLKLFVRVKSSVPNYGRAPTQIGERLDPETNSWVEVAA